MLPDVAWYKDGEQLDSAKTTLEQQSNGMYNAELEIRSAQYSDTGFYTCMVQNLFGINSGNVTLKVKGNAKDFSLPFPSRKGLQTRIVFIGQPTCTDILLVHTYIAGKVG